MLRDDLKNLKREHPEGLSVQNGGCKFCGQMAQILTLFSWSEDDCSEAATELCQCLEAKEYTYKKDQREKTLKAIEKQFGSRAGEYETETEIQEILIKSVEPLMEDKIQSISIEIGNGLKAKLSLTAKGQIKVNRTKTIKATIEA